MSTIRERVEAGAKLLDEKVPGWREKIDLDSLDVGNHSSCILGQLYGEYSAGMRLLLGRPSKSWECSAALGFIHETSAREEVKNEIACLTDGWRAFLSESS